MANYRGAKRNIGVCSDVDLGLSNSTGGIHYIYIRDVKKNGMCSVSTFTSLEDKKHNIKVGKISRVRNGELYAIPTKQATFPLWTALSKEIHFIHISKIKRFGAHRVKSKRHFFMMNKHK